MIDSLSFDDRVGNESKFLVLSPEVPFFRIRGVPVPDFCKWVSRSTRPTATLRDSSRVATPKTQVDGWDSNTEYPPTLVFLLDPRYLTAPGRT